MSAKRVERTSDSAALLARLRGHFALGYLALFGAALALGFASWPIFAADTDLWYHLNAGRYIAATHALPATAFFSFVHPAPAALDYYWLSQLVYHGVYSAAGYFGLVELRALVALATYALVLATLRIGKGREGWGTTAALFSAIALVLVGRLTMVRPCDLSYLAIAGFLFALESRRGLLALPLAAVLWMNMHGIEWPVMLLILGAYLAEWVLARAGLLPNVSAPQWRAFAAAGVSILCLLATPHGAALISAPFAPLGFASQYIDELRPVELALRLDGLYVSRPTFLVLLLGAGVWAAISSFSRERLRPAHLALFAGGLVLVTRAERFTAELVLLLVPLLGSFAPRLPKLVSLPESLRAALVAAVALLPFWHLYAVLETRCAFPLCPRELPLGSAAFLEKVGATGTVLNHPNIGGYLQWALYPRQKIFADLQTPFLFSDRDVFASQQAFRDPAALASLVAEYRPAFLLAPRAQAAFAGWVSQVGDYAPVFFDDASVLYASRESQAALVASHQLSAIDPFSLELLGDSADPGVLARAAAELARVNEIYPEGAGAGVAEGQLALRRGDSERALAIAERVTRAHPDRPDGPRLRGDALFRAAQFAEAAAAYEMALDRAQAAGSRSDSPGQQQDVADLEGRLWASYLRLGRNEEAYRALQDSLGDLYRPSVSHQELASLALSALAAGHAAEGRTLLEFALAKTPDSDSELRRNLEARLRSLAATR